MVVKSKYIPVIGNADQNFYPGLCVAFLSILNAASGEYNYKFFVLNGGIPINLLDELEEKLQILAQKKSITISLTPLELDDNKLQPLPPRRGSRMPYAKLILPDLLPHENYAVYVDADILYHSGVEELFVNSINSKEDWLLSGVQDYYGILKNECPWGDLLTPEEQQLPYINSGVMVMNLKSFRENGLLDEAIILRAKAGEQRLGDQSVFNFVCRGRILLNPRHFNYMVSLGSGLHILNHGTTSNIHFIGNNKPWRAEPNISQYTAHILWHEFADQYGIQREITQLNPPNPSLLKRHASKRWSNIFNSKRSQNYKNDLTAIQQTSKQ